MQAHATKSSVAAPAAKAPSRDGPRPAPTAAAGEAGLALQLATATERGSDRWEREADHAADVALSIRTCACGGSCPECAAARTGAPLARSITPYRAPTVARSAEAAPRAEVPRATAASLGVPPHLALALAASRGAGAPLEPATRARMEAGFGADFSGVRVHTDARAAELSHALGARAFTSGSDVYFGRGRYDPGSAGGQRLIAHELTHTLQQAGDGGAHPVQLEPEYLIYRPSAESAFILYRRHHGPLRPTMEQEYEVSIHGVRAPGELTFLWLVYDDATDDVIYRQDTGHEPRVAITASRTGDFRVGVVIERNGELITQHLDGMVLRANETVLPSLEDEALAAEAAALGETSRSWPPSCDEPGEPLEGPRTVDFGEVARPRDNCSFSVLYDVQGRSFNVAAEVTGPADAGGGDWRLTVFECPVHFPTGAACEHTFGEASVHGAVPNRLELSYDPIAWTSNKVYVQIRNGTLGPLQVRLRLDPNVRDPVLQMAHDVLMLVGLVPAVGAVADGLDVLLYAAEGDWAEAGLSAAAMAPAFGEAATALRIGRREMIRVPRWDPLESTCRHASLSIL